MLLYMSALYAFNLKYDIYTTLYIELDDNIIQLCIDLSNHTADICYVAYIVLCNYCVYMQIKCDVLFIQL